MNWSSNSDINVLHTLPITESKLKQIQDKTKEDKALQDLMVTVHNGWPPNKTDAPIGAKPFWNYRDEISHHHGILFKGQKVIIPTCMRTEMLQIIHSSHLGIEKCK